MITYLGRDLDWRAFAIPQSTPEVSMAVLRPGKGGGASMALVRFPSGWERPGSGHYTCDEEFVVLEGELQVSGEVFEAGDRGWFPAGRRRFASRAHHATLALAWFSGPARWVPAY